MAGELPCYYRKSSIKYITHTIAFHEIMPKLKNLAWPPHTFPFYCQFLASKLRKNVEKRSGIGILSNLSFDLVLWNPMSLGIFLCFWKNENKRGREGMGGLLSASLSIIEGVGLGVEEEGHGARVTHIGANRVVCSSRFVQSSSERFVGFLKQKAELY